MLIIKCNNDKIDSAIKKYRQKVKNTKLITEVKERRYFTKKSENRRKTVLKAIHKNKILSTWSEGLD